MDVENKIKDLETSLEKEVEHLRCRVVSYQLSLEEAETKLCKVKILQKLLEDSFTKNVYHYCPPLDLLEKNLKNVEFEKEVLPLCEAQECYYCWKKFIKYLKEC